MMDAGESSVGLAFTAWLATVLAGFALLALALGIL
jgi:hypothetical protein